jgi:hypothetical protein
MAYGEWPDRTPPARSQKTLELLPADRHGHHKPLRYPRILAAPRGLNLPQYQYTARDGTTGLLFLGYSNELSLAHATVFAERIIRHLLECRIDLAHPTWQSDNGSDFIGSWQARNDSAFTQAIQRVNGQSHRTIPPGQHQFHAPPSQRALSRSTARINPSFPRRGYDVRGPSPLSSNCTLGLPRAHAMMIAADA